MCTAMVHALLFTWTSMLAWPKAQFALSPTRCIRSDCTSSAQPNIVCLRNQMQSWIQNASAQRQVIRVTFEAQDHNQASHLNYSYGLSKCGVASSLPHYTQLGRADHYQKMEHSWLHVHLVPVRTKGAPGNHLVSVENTNR